MTYRILDLFCGSGGSGVGYHRAGFEVVGVDIYPQPDYPFAFVQSDAIQVLRGGFYWRPSDGKEYGLNDFDAIHTSPVCKAYTTLVHGRWKQRDYPQQIDEVRHYLKQIGKPYVIENVRNSGLIDPLVLCGSMFGLKVIRHRYFENSIGLFMSPFICSHPINAVGRRGHLGDREWMTITGHFSNIEKAKNAMGIDWMHQSGLAQAIPPAYTEFVGSHLIAYLNGIHIIDA